MATRIIATICALFGPGWRHHRQRSYSVQLGDLVLAIAGASAETFQGSAFRLWLGTSLLLIFAKLFSYIQQLIEIKRFGKIPSRALIERLLVNIRARCHNHHR